MRCWSLRRSRRLACLATALILFPVSSAHAQGSPPAAPAGDPAPAFQALLENYYRAYSRKDLEGMSAAWHPKGPARLVRNMAELEFELRDTEFKAVRLSGVAVDAGGGRARAMVDLLLTDRKTGRSRLERRVRDLTFLQDGNEWKVWNEASAAVPLARRILTVPPGELSAVLAAEPELLSDDALRGLTLGGRLRAEGQAVDLSNVLTIRLEVARAAGNELVAADCLRSIGLKHQMGGDYAEARRAFTEARDLYARAGTERDVAMSDMNLGAVEYLEGRYAPAMERYLAALRHFESAKDLPQVASTRHSVANCLYLTGEFERALEMYSLSLAANEEADNKSGAAAVHLAMALVHKELGNYTQAGEAYARSALLASGLGDLSGMAKALHGQGEVSRLQGDHALALQAFHRALDAWAKAIDPPNRATTMYAIGQVHAAEHSFTAAAEWYGKALEVDTGAVNKPGIARDTGGLAGAHFAMGQVDAALEEYLKSLELREALDDMPGVAWTLLHMGVLHMSQSRLDDAMRVYVRAIGIAEKIGEQPALGVGHALKASAELAAGAPEEALESVARALVFAGRTEQFDAIAFARTVEGKIHRDGGRPAQARAAFEEAIAAVAKVPTGPGAETFFTDRRGPYVALADLLVREDQPAAALDWLERGRQHALATLLGGDGAMVTKGLTAAERDEERSLTKALRSVAVRLRRERGRESPDPVRETALREELAKAAAQREELRLRFYAAHPDLRILRAQAEPVPVQAVLSTLLRPGDALLTFAVTDSRTHVLVARVAPRKRQGGSEQATGAAETTEPAVGVYSASAEIAGSDLAARVVRLRDALQARDDAAPALASELYSLLLLPVEAHLGGVVRVVVIPDASLWGLPFEALRAPSGRYLVERAAVSYAPSLAALSAAASRAGAAAKPTGRVLALGAPVVTKTAEERVGLLRPGRKLALSGSTERETRAVMTIAGPARGQALLGAKATAGPLQDGVPPGAIVHVAAPLFLSEANPLHSLLVLSPAGNEDTGLTEIGNALGWELPAAAAVFPAAESGSSGESGDAFAALSWSLLVAGTPAAVVSRWPLAARAPARLDPMVAAFYRAQLAAAPAAGAASGSASAAQRAARRLLTSPATKHPGYWAGLMVIGR